MPSRKNQLIEFFRSLIPTRVITRHDPRSVLAALAQNMTVDEVHTILRAAEAGNSERLFALYRDILLAHAHLQGRFADRKRAVLGDTLTLQPFDKKNPDDVKAKDALWPITQHADWLPACNHLLDAALWPVAVVEKVYRQSTVAGQSYELARLVPVPHDLLDFATGRLRIKDTDEEGRPLSTTHAVDEHRYIVHRGHLLTTPDHWGGPMRSLLFWWLLGTMGREWWARFLDRYGAPFIVGKYDQSDDDSRSILQTAFTYATKIGGLVVSRDTEIEIKQAAVRDSGDAFERFHAICNEEMSKLILGQTLSSDAKGTGMGSGVANAQEGVRHDVRQFDAKLLGATITLQLARQFLAINGIAGRPPLFAWGGADNKEAQVTGALLSSLSQAGLELTDDGVEALSERVGLPLQRSAAPRLPDMGSGGFQAHGVGHALLADAAGVRIARTAAAALAHTLGKHHAPIRRIILESRSPQEALANCESYFKSHSVDLKAANLITEEVLMAYAANGSVAHTA